MTSRDGFTIVWDWNGTLCDDRTILLDAVGQTLVNEGFEPLSQQQLIQRFARPLRTFFENACGRDLLTSEWERVQSTFRRIYRSREAEVTLVEDAYDVLAQGNRSAAGQFLLSLAPHDELMHFVQKYGIAKWFNEIRGRTRPDQALDATYHQIRIAKNPDCAICGDAPTITELVDDSVSCASTQSVDPELVISCDELRTKQQSDQNEPPR